MPDFPRLAVLAGLAIASLPSAGGAQRLMPPPPGQGGPHGPVDPGPRAGSPDAGGPLAGLNSYEAAFFAAAKSRFEETDSVSGGIAGENGAGLGPRFNGNSCAQCHAFPATGGTSPATNPQVALATLDGATNKIPPFIQKNGPVREARLISKPDGSPDGGVHQLYTIAGRSDAPGCSLAQPNWAAQVAARNVSLRIPTPVFGLGLVESTPDATLTAAFAASAARRAALGIGGHFNTSDNDGTIMRFGWKAQNKSLLIFSGEAYNVEMGASNEVFPNEIAAVPGCEFNRTAEDRTPLTNGTNSGSPASDYASDTVNFAAFARLSAAPTPAAASAGVAQGLAVFKSTGCDACHTPSLTTGNAGTAALRRVTYAPYSDFAVHAMGAGLADGIQQGSAKSNEFRTAPLWGLGQRLFFLHDGRTGDLNQAILEHASPGSEANEVIEKYRRLPPAQANQLLQFLRSL